MTPSELTVRKVSHRGDVREWTLNPVWARLHRETHEEFGLQRLFLVSQRPAADDRGLPRPAGEGKLCARLGGRAGGGQARADADGAGIDIPS